MKKPLEIIVMVIIGGCLCSAFIGEILVNGEYDFRHIFKKGSFYAILVYIFIIFAYYGLKAYLLKIKIDIINETCKRVKNEIKIDLKNEIKKEIDNEIKQQVAREVRNRYHNMKTTVVKSVKDELQSHLTHEISKNIKIDLIENSQWIEYIMYKSSQKSNTNDNLVELSSLHNRLESKIDDFLNNIKPKISKGASRR